MTNHLRASISVTPPSPAHSEPWWLLSSVSSALQAAAGVAAVKTESGPAGTSAGPAAPSAEQVVSPFHAAAAAEPWKRRRCRGKGGKAHGGETRQRGQDRKVWRSIEQG